MVTGEAFKRISSDHNRQFLVDLVEDDLRSRFSQALLYLFSLVKVVNSSKRHVDTGRIRILGLVAYYNLVTIFPWCLVSPSVHRILGHSWEVMSMNMSYGLGNVSEEGLESINKFIRHLRTRGARKTSTVHNFSDVFGHLWDRSRPLLTAIERKISKKKPQVLIATQIEATVEGLFLEEEAEENEEEEEV